MTTSQPRSLLPEGSCLLHIGPPKTGTTSLQAAFWAARRDALAQGVRYAGKSRHESRAAYAVAHSDVAVRRPDELQAWVDLASEVRAARDPRLVLSSEHLAYAGPDAVERILRDLAGRQVFVVVTLRPLARILPSRWQEYAKGGLGEPYEAWLREILGAGGEELTPGFWRQQRHDQVVTRWAAAAGREHVRVVVVDDRDPGGLLRIFEGLTGLRPGTLAPVPDLSNRSLTAVEAELVRALTSRLRTERHRARDIDRIVRGGAVRHLLGRDPGPDEPRIETPAWALDRIGGVARDMVAGITASGVPVLGDLELLTAVPGAGAPAVAQDGRDAEAVLAGTREAAAWLAVGMFRAGRVEPEPSVRVAAGRLVRALAGHLPPGIRGRAARLVGRTGAGLPTPPRGSPAGRPRPRSSRGRR